MMTRTAHNIQGKAISMTNMLRESPFFHQLVMLCLMNPKMWFSLLVARAHCWFCWPSTSIPISPYLLSCSPVTCLPVCTCVQHYTIPDAEPIISPFELHAVTRRPVFQYIWIPLQGLLTLQKVSSISWFNVISRLAEDALQSYIWIIDKNVK